MAQVHDILSQASAVDLLFTFFSFNKQGKVAQVHDILFVKAPGKMKNDTKEKSCTSVDLHDVVPYRLIPACVCQAHKVNPLLGQGPVEGGGRNGSTTKDQV